MIRIQIPSEDGKDRFIEIQDEAWCKGSFLLGSACGRCTRCVDEALQLVPQLLKERRVRIEESTLIHHAIPDRPLAGHQALDFTDKFKLACFEEARRILYDRHVPKEGNLDV